MDIEIDLIGNIYIAANSKKEEKNYIKELEDLVNKLDGIKLKNEIRIFLPIILINNIVYDKIYYSNISKIKDVLINNTRLQKVFGLNKKDMLLLLSLDNDKIHDIILYFKRNPLAIDRVREFTEKFHKNNVMPKKEKKKIKKSKTGLLSKFIVSTINGSDQIITANKLDYLQFADDSDSADKLPIPDNKFS